MVLSVCKTLVSPQKAFEMLWVGSRMRPRAVDHTAPTTSMHEGASREHGASTEHSIYSIYFPKNGVSFLQCQRTWIKVTTPEEGYGLIRRQSHNRQCVELIPPDETVSYVVRELWARTNWFDTLICRKRRKPVQ